MGWDIKMLIENIRPFVQAKFAKALTLIQPNSIVLDIGCNDGAVRKLINNCDYYAVDVNKEQIEGLVKQNVNAKVIDLNRDNLPFNMINFDYILMLDILEHLIDPVKLMLECKKRLNKNGKLIIALPNDYNIVNKFRFLFNGCLTSTPFSPYGHLHYYPIKKAEQTLIDECGYKILKKIILASPKPQFIPQSIKCMVANIFPQTFARNVIYLLEVK